jgi:hypothetical protein
VDALRPGLIIAVALASVSPAARASSDVFAPVPVAPSSAPSAAAYSLQVQTICSGARLFDGTHEIGTRAGAIAVARDIRMTGRRRLARVAALPRPASRRARLAAWLALERRLVALYATTYVRIWNAIDSAHTVQQRRGLPRVLRALIDKPRPLEARAAALELELGFGDCTGGRGTAGVRS